MRKVRFIMAIDMTVSNQINSKKAGYSGVQKHTEHDPNINHSNINLDVDRLQFNHYENTAERKQALMDWQEEKFHDFVEEHDKHQRETGHGERQWGSVKAYIEKKNKPTGVLTLGSVESQGKLMKALCPADVLCTKHSPEGYDYTTFDLEVHKDKSGKPMSDTTKYPEEAKRLQKVHDEAEKFYSCVNRALLHATSNNLTVRNPNGDPVRFSNYFYIGRRATNVDEGACHIHYELGACGKTRKGRKLTNSFNNSLIELHHAATGEYASGKQSMKWLRTVWDSYALDCLNKELTTAYKRKEPVVNFERKTEKDGSYITGLSMDQFKNKQQLIDKAKKAQNQAQQSEQKAQEATDAVRDAYEGATGKKAINKDNTPLQTSDMLTGLKHHLNKTKDEIKQKEQQKKDLDDELKNLQDQKKQAVQDASEAQTELENLRNRILQRRRQRIEELEAEINQHNLRWGENKVKPELTNENIEWYEKSVDNWRRNKHKKLSEENKSLTSKNAELTTTNQSLTDTNKALQTTNDYLIQQNDSLTATNQALKTNNEALKDEHKTLTQQVKDLKTKVTTLTKEAERMAESFKYSAGTFVKTHWKELKATFDWYAMKHNEADNYRQHHDPYTAKSVDSDAKMGIINTFDRIQRQATNEYGKDNQHQNNLER